MRIVKSAEEFFDILESIPDNRFISVGYVTGANLDVPIIKRRNPATNRMKGYPDYSVFQSDKEIGALVGITAFNFRFRYRNVVTNTYRNTILPQKNKIRSEYNLPPVKEREEDYKKRNDWGNGNTMTYDGKNQALKGHTYIPQNTYNARRKTTYYIVGTDGHIIRQLSEEEVHPFLGKYKPVEGESALRKMGVEEERVQEYIKRIKDLGFSQKNFEFNSILWLCATANGEPIIYINDNFARAVDDIDVRPEDFRAIARARYKIELSQLGEALARRKPLTEGVIRRAIRRSINEVLGRRLFI